MKKFILADSGKEINFGDKILIIQDENTPLREETSIRVRRFMLFLLRMEGFMKSIRKL